MNEYVSKRIAEIAKERGYKAKSFKFYDKSNEINTHWNHKEVNNNDSPFKYYTAPTYQQLIEWIFKFDIPQDEYERQIIIQELEFWYNTLIPELCNVEYGIKTDFNGNNKDYYKIIGVYNEFVLEGFIGMLLNWFEKNNIELIFL